MTYKGFITTLMAAAIAITSLSAAPAKADNTAKIIAGVAALAIIGAAIADATDDDDIYVSRHYYRGHGNRFYNNNYHRNYHRSYHRNRLHGHGYYSHSHRHSHGHNFNHHHHR